MFFDRMGSGWYRSRPLRNPVFGSLLRDMNDQRTPASPDTYKILTGPYENATKLSDEIVESHIMRTEYVFHHDKVAFCMLHMKNGFIAKGMAGVVDPANFDRKIGEKLSRNRAKDQVYLVMGYQLQSELAMKRLEEANSE